MVSSLDETVGVQWTDAPLSFAQAVMILVIRLVFSTGAQISHWMSG